ncbi:hypothetical protein [Sphingobacterium daejeonense]|uniref:hypothetical protein n=1 Tax=Sphingobacterium daejeonense TaxID=371142 RepID=UPI001484CB6A|nr:hypothetical protein [Sphingobacterium daejeonense]
MPAIIIAGTMDRNNGIPNNQGKWISYVTSLKDKSTNYHGKTMREPNDNFSQPL